MDFQIRKKTGVYDVEAMRSKQFFSTDFNMNNKKKGKEVIQRAEELHLILEKTVRIKKRKTINFDRIKQSFSDRYLSTNTTALND